MIQFCIMDGIVAYLILLSGVGVGHCLYGKKCD